MIGQVLADIAADPDGRPPGAVLAYSLLANLVPDERDGVEDLLGAAAKSGASGGLVVGPAKARVGILVQPSSVASMSIGKRPFEPGAKAPIGLNLRASPQGHVSLQQVDPVPTAACLAEARERGRSVDLLPSVGRNETCPCGSGRKYKMCCLGRRSPDGRR